MIVIDSTIPWWKFRWATQRILHLFGRCDGFGRVTGRDCPVCYIEAMKMSGGMGD